MQDDADSTELLHLGDLALPEDTPFGEHVLDVIASPGQRLLAEDDRIALGQLLPGEVQEWCLSRILEYQNNNRLLREWYGAAVRNAISKNKSHIRAIRSAYNNAAQINRHFPPEMLMEIFSHVHPATLMPRPRLPVLGVCCYWRRLLFHTPQFWANLLSLPSWKSWIAEYHHEVRRFGAAMTLSAPQILTISILYCYPCIADILASHAARLSSLKVGPTEYYVGSAARVLEQDMPLLTSLVVLYQLPLDLKHAAIFALSLPRYPNIRTIEFEGAHFYIPGAPSTSLRHLKLTRCTILPPPPSTVRALCAMLAALRSFPNLETLSLIYSLSGDDPRGNTLPLPVLTETTHLPCLRRLEPEDLPAYIPLFLSHLVLPSTTALVLEPVYMRDYSRRRLVIPLFPGINPSPPSTSPSDTELSLSLYSRMKRNDENVARWETHGPGVRPVRVTLPSTRLRTQEAVALVANVTRKLVAALTPVPVPVPVPATPLGVTSLTITQSFGYLDQSDWRRLLLELPALRRADCMTGGRWATNSLVSVLGDPRPESPRFLCPRLAELGLGWSMPRDADLGLGLPRGHEGGLQVGEWDSLTLQQDSDSDDGHLGKTEGTPPASGLAASLAEFCGEVGACLTARAAGRCEPIRKLSVSLYVHVECRYPNLPRVLEGWQVALVEQRLRRALGHLVGDVAVAREIN